MSGWGDDDDDEVPARTESVPDAQGRKSITEYRMNSSGQRVKTVSVVKVMAVQSRESKEIAGRRLRMKKFGAAASSTDESNVTIRSKDEERVVLEEEDGGGHAQQHSVKEAMNEFAKRQMWRKLQQKYNVSDSNLPPPPEEEEESELAEARRATGRENTAKVEAPASRSTYVPPSMRGKELAAGSGMQRMQAYEDRDHATLRVTNISEDTKEQDLQALFSPYGRIARIYLAKDRDTLISRGFAFISYHNRDDAARAMQALQGHGYDHLILKIEWAKPSTRDPSTDGGLSGGYTSGYGKALAQDTKERVSYASNLTR